MLLFFVSTSHKFYFLVHLLNMGTHLLVLFVLNLQLIAKTLDQLFDILIVFGFLFGFFCVFVFGVFGLSRITPCTSSISRRLFLLITRLLTLLFLLFILLIKFGDKPGASVEPSWSYSVGALNLLGHLLLFPFLLALLRTQLFHWR